MTDSLADRVTALEAAVAELQHQPAAPAPDLDGELWVLDGIKARHPEGAVVFAGTMPAGPGPESGEIAWQWGVLTAEVRDQEWDAAVPVFDALSHPVRLRLLQQVLNGTATTAELADGVEMGTTGQLHHHLRALTAAGWLTSTGRGRWAVPPARAIPLLVLITGRHALTIRKDTTTMTARRRLVFFTALLGALLIGALGTLVGGPRSPRLGAVTGGDPALAADVRAALVDDRGYQSISAARWRDGRASYAGLGDAGSGAPTPQTPFELGSITKTFTGQLLADGVRRGELRLDDPLSSQLPELAETPAGAVTLRELATHTGGLPPFPPSMTPGFLLGTVANENSYGGPTADLLAATRTATVTDRGTYRYSNLGMSLLGHAEARAAGATDWPTLATDRLLRPLGMTHTFFALDAAAVPADRARPHAENGWPTANWWGPAFAPAGSSTWTTAEDLMRYAQAVLDGSAPGSTALDPMLPIPDGQIGLAWHLTDHTGGPQITWHNGATGGYRSMLALDRQSGQAVVLLGNSVRPVDRVGLKLAATAAGAPVEAVDRLAPSRGTFSWGIVGLVLVGSFAYSALRGKTRLALVNAGLTGVTGLVILLAHGPWAVVPAWLWGSLTGAGVVLAAAAVLRGRTRTLPAYAERRRVLGWLSLALTVAVLGLVVWTT